LNTDLLNKIEKHISGIYKDKLPDDNCYHNLTHTEEVVGVAKELARLSNVNDEDMETLIIAAWFHDIGYLKQCEGHEEASAEMAADFLQSNNYPDDKINKVKDLIRVTRIPQRPKNLLQEIICDADLHHLGVKDFAEKGEMLRCEIEKYVDKKFSNSDWLKNNIMFFKHQEFFTPAAKEKFEAQKKINLNKIKDELKNIEKKKKDKKKKHSQDGEQSELKEKAGRSIETMFRNTMRTHVAFSSMADTKANIMISVNTLVLTIIVSVMIRKLDTNPHLVIPTAMLTLTSLLALIYAILVTRPKITSGTFSSEDIKNKKTNLLFFGNFYNVSLKDFAWGMKEMIEDRNYLYDAMITDFYYLGQVLGKKYKQLRICYTIFMFGVIISVIAFAIAYMMYPDGTNLGPLID
jgi:predicted metal-dependent HD superfamily phosphohydrolase